MTRDEAIKMGQDQLAQKQAEVFGSIYDAGETAGAERAGGGVDNTPYGDADVKAAVDAAKAEANAVIDQLKSDLSKSQADDLSDKAAIEAGQKAKVDLEAKINQIVEILTRPATPAPTPETTEPKEGEATEGEKTEEQA